MFKIRFIVRPIVCITYGANTALKRVNHWLHGYGICRTRTIITSWIPLLRLRAKTQSVKLELTQANLITLSDNCVQAAQTTT